MDHIAALLRAFDTGQRPAWYMPSNMSKIESALVILKAVVANISHRQ